MSESNDTYLSRSRRPREDSDLGAAEYDWGNNRSVVSYNSCKQAVHTVKPLLQVMSSVALEYLLRGDDRLKSMLSNADGSHY